MISQKRFMIIWILSFVALGDLVVLLIFWKDGDLWTTSTLLVTIVVTVVGIGGGLLGWLIMRIVYNRLIVPSKNAPINKPTTIKLPKELNVEYELNIDDVLAFYSYNFQRPPLGRSRILLRYSNLAFAILLACCAAILWVIDRQSIWPIFIIIIAVMMLFFFFFSLFLTGKALKSAVLKNYGQGKNRLVGKHEFSITPTELTDKTDMGETITLWEAIEYVATTNQYLFLVVRASGPFIVPKKAFANDITFKQFAETATVYQQASMAQQSETPP